jgi:uncharacterized protein (TIRG00374 family)
MTSKTKSLIKRIIGIIIVAIIFGFFAYYIYTHISDFKQLTLVNPFYLLVLVVLFLISYTSIGVVTKTLLHPFNIKLKKLEAFAISITTGFYNLITPFRGGAMIRAAYLKRKHAFSYSDFIATLSASYVIIFFIGSLLGLISVLSIYFSEGIFSSILFFIFLGIFLPMLCIILFSPKISESKNKFLNKFIHVINGWHLIKNNKKVILTTAIATLINLLIGTLMIYLQFKVFGFEITFAKSLFLTSLGNISILISITPANLGITEAITVFSANTIGITPIQSLPVTLLGRAIQMTTLFVLGPIFSVILFKHKPKGEEK